MHLQKGLWMAFTAARLFKLTFVTEYLKVIIIRSFLFEHTHKHAHLQVSQDQKKKKLSEESWQRPDLAQSREIPILQCCSIKPSLCSWSGILLIVQVTETEEVDLKRSAVEGHNGLSQPINVSSSSLAHWLPASLPSRVLSDQPLAQTA